MRFDFHALLRALTRTKSLAALAETVTAGISASRSVVLVRVWVEETPQNPLVLFSSAGTPSGGGSYTRLDGEFREMAVADTTIREIAASRQPLVVRGVRGDEEWLINSAWAARQGVRSFVALPLVVEPPEPAVGVIAFFDRELPDDTLLRELLLVADVCAVRVEELRHRAPAPSSSAVTSVVTRTELRRIEKENIEAALAKSGGRIFGSTGAAVLLGMRPTTLASRIKALGIERATFT